MTETFVHLKLGYLEEVKEKPVKIKVELSYQI